MADSVHLPCTKNRYVGTANPNDAGIFARAIAILNASRYCTLSTISPDSTPWGSPIFFVTDHELNVYWSSALAAQHSINLTASDGDSSHEVGGHAMLTMYRPHDASGQTQGLYLRGKARAINEEPQVVELLPLMVAKSGRPMTRTALDYLGKSSRRFYRFTPHEVWITGDRLIDGNQLIDTKIILDVAKLKELV